MKWQVKIHECGSASLLERYTITVTILDFPTGFHYKTTSNPTDSQESETPGKA